jgi:hypothetical protein
LSGSSDNHKIKNQMPHGYGLLPVEVGRFYLWKFGKI